MRNIAFTLSMPQFLDGSKTVTRRNGWDFLRAGDMIRVVRKNMGLKKGETVEVLGFIRAIDVRRERVRCLTDDVAYGLQETTKEGFPDGHPLHLPCDFVAWFCKTHRCRPTDKVTRIEFERVKEAP